MKMTLIYWHSEMKIKSYLIYKFKTEVNQAKGSKISEEVCLQVKFRQFFEDGL